jgi:hypothetical protein
MLTGSGLRAETGSPNFQAYTNQASGFVVVYPADWVATSRYRNAFEIRNYGASSAVPKQNQASVMISQETFLSQSQAERRVQDLIAAASLKSTNLSVAEFTIDGFAAFQWRGVEPAAAPQVLRGQVPPAQPLRLRVATAIIRGVELLRLEGTTWADADPRVVTQLQQIGKQVKFIAQSKPNAKDKP